MVLTVSSAKRAPCAGPPSAAERQLSLRAHRQDYSSLQIEVRQGDANVVVDDILKILPKTQPVLAFLDPEGSELDWATIEKIARHKQGKPYKIEQFILFPSDTGIIRFFPRDAAKLVYEDKLDRMLPSAAGWRALYKLRDQLTTAEFRRRLLNEYVSGLKALGYKHVPQPRLVCKPDGRPLYFMVFATDNEVGLKIMSAALETVEATTLQSVYALFTRVARA